jgi:hypothetical protein
MGCVAPLLLLAAMQNPPAPAAEPDALPVSIPRIQRLLERAPAIVVEEGQPIFRLQVFGRQPTIEEWLGRKFWLGPAPYAMARADFIPTISPPGFQVRIGFNFTPLIVSLIKGVRAAKHAHDERAARAEVAAALAELLKARREAGLDRD